MESIREILLADSTVSLAVGGLVIGTIFGVIVFRTNFCTMGSISDILSFGDYRRFRSWLLAIATAMVCAQLLQQFGVVDLGKSMYLTGNLNWFNNIVGGLLFGFGMVFAGGCASRNLVRAGSGDLRSLLVLVVIGMFAYMTIGGIIGPLRAEIQDLTQVDLSQLKLGSQSAGAALALGLSIEEWIGRWLVAVVVAGGFLVYCFSDSGFRKSPEHLVAGFGVGLCIVASWALTGLAYDEFAERAQLPISLTYVRPVGDTTEYLMRFTANMIPTFGVSTVFGALLGSFLSAVATSRFQVTGFANKADTLHNLFGAMLMGIGGVLALGCTVGQAITGMSTLAMGSMITFVAIVTGGVLGMKSFERMLMAE